MKVKRKGVLLKATEVTKRNHTYFRFGGGGDIFGSLSPPNITLVNLWRNFHTYDNVMLQAKCYKDNMANTQKTRTIKYTGTSNFK
jgi:hypothetical protein